LNVRDFVNHQTAVLLRRLAYEVSHAAKNSDEESIHDLRVAIRRLSRCLQAFSQFYRGQIRKKIRRKLKDLMEAAGDVRDRDIASRLLVEAGVPAESIALQTLAEDRVRAARQLSAVLTNWKQHSFSRKWRRELGL
jgi:CHAD domain-containing protein